MNSSPGVSVIICSYNHGRFLPSCINSVLNQSYANFEIIVIDDGSTDNTKEFIKPYLNRITYRYQENQGRGASRNTGINLAQYRWIAFLDADDLWVPDKLEKQIKAVTEHPEIDLLVTNACWFDGDTIVQKDYFKSMNLFHKQPVDHYGHLHIFTDKLYELFIDENFVNLSSVLVRKSCLYDIGLFDVALPRAQDRDLWLRLSRIYTFAYLDEILTKSRTHSLNDGLRTIYPYLSRIQLFEKAYKFESDLEGKHETRLRKRLARCHFDLGHFFLFKLKELQKARGQFKKALEYDPACPNARFYSNVTYIPRPIFNGLRWLKRKLLPK